MRRLVLLGPAAALLLAGCSGAPAPEATPQQAPSTSARVELPPEPEPVAEGSCPYLDADFVARSNGQRVGEVRTSADKPHPSCFFYRPDGDIQLTVRLYSGERAVAKSIVDKAAPVDDSNPTSQPPGWQGGYVSTEDGAVYAVAKAGDAVVVTTNQRQSVKARTVTEEVIAALGL